jgi:hypothetical protein
LVERLLAMQKVASSNPVARSKKPVLNESGFFSPKF